MAHGERAVPALLARRRPRLLVPTPMSDDQLPLYLRVGESDLYQVATVDIPAVSADRVTLAAALRDLADRIDPDQTEDA